MLASGPRAARCLGVLALFTACAAACAPSNEIVTIPTVDAARDAPRDVARDVADARVDAPRDTSIDAVSDRPSLDVQPLDRPSLDAPDAATDTAPVDTGPPRCGAGIDTDMDGLTNSEECTLGTDPFVADSDRDGVLDGQEVGYPRGCLSPTSAAQRRPPPACTTDAQCRTGERCAGLDPRARDTDGDGVDDGLEDRNLDGVIDAAHGETDPRLADTDGDSRSDSMGGLEICRPSGLATVTQLGLPGADVQTGFDPRWTGSRRVTGTMMRSGVMLEDPATNLAGATFNMPSMGDIRMEATRVETTVVAGLGAGVSPVLVGRAFTTHEMNQAITSTYRVARATTASALRDAVAVPMLGVAVMPPTTAVGTSTEFLVDVTTVRRTMGTLGVGTTDAIVTVAPRADYENPARDTAIRSNDLINATSMAPIDRGLGANCQVFRATRTAMADFVWTVDTSGSMSDDQERLGRTATQFFTRLNAAGVDFRVGVLNAGSGTLNLDSPGFTWIQGTDAMGARTLCETVTYSTCPTSTTDRLAPYAFSGGSEEPTAAAIIAHNEFTRRARAGETNPNRRFREGALIVTFHVTDEPGSNDFSRYFASSSDPQTMVRWGATYSAATLANIVTYFSRNNILTFGLVPLSATARTVANVVDLPRCVIEGNRGAVIPIATATDAEVSTAMMRIVEAVAGASSPFVLERVPITSTIKVRVRGRDVPRSRTDGFDYDGASRSIIIYGPSYRPAMGDEVVVSYRLWQPCPSAGASCVTDSDCCAPHTCRERRCSPPCRPAGSMCTADADCCAPNACISGVCAPRPMCVASGGRCTPGSTNECCPPDMCVDGTCGQCRGVDEACSRDSDCCNGSPCMGGRCGCRPTSGRCTTPRDCCSRYCVDGQCGPG